MTEIILSVVFIVLLLFCIDPFHLWMPTAIETAALVGLALAGVVYAGLIFRQRPRDERESLHLMRSTQAGFLVGVVGLCGFIVYQMATGAPLSKGVVVILAIMVVVKLLTLLWQRRRS
jgi:O-antigen/teichoic acid export membrane protein